MKPKGLREIVIGLKEYEVYNKKNMKVGVDLLGSTHFIECELVLCMKIHRYAVINYLALNGIKI